MGCCFSSDLFRPISRVDQDAPDLNPPKKEKSPPTNDFTVQCPNCNERLMRSFPTTTCSKCKTVFEVSNNAPMPTSMLMGDAYGSHYAPAQF